ncbi:glycoside hydrolase family 105 protein [Paenibacillus sp. YN15]|uniref:glycoside hydrolase family 88/105 protein n=1 Tax=Paenibacillus sp. YN15 TaxID=1742774 RepID=UPI000DCC7402|nr:glycoside hydrolase family 88 protein [Paenibacillus sp. YN15]RAU97315.1 hypothetical protein DQG13_18950 [Paenibacillus sp. YN15]
MGFLFSSHRSAEARLGEGDIGSILQLIGSRYIGENPPLPYVYRTCSLTGICQLPDGRYDLRLTERLPEASGGQYAYAAGKVWSDGERKLELSVSCCGPTLLWVNGKPLYQSGIAEEVSPSVVRYVQMELHNGWNMLFLRFRKTPSGFGCLLGSARSKWAPLDVLSPFGEREGQAGWVYSQATDIRFGHEGAFPDMEGLEAANPLVWHPRQRTPYADSGRYILSWSLLRQPEEKIRPVRISGSAAGEWMLYVNGSLAGKGNGPELQVHIRLPYGNHSVVVIGEGAADAIGLQAVGAVDETPLSWRCPHPVQGYGGVWLTAGGFDKPPVDAAAGGPSIRRLYSDGTVRRCWRAGAADAAIRPYAESRLFGKWNYPVGVTLYGLLQAGRLTGRADFVSYVRKHLQECAAAYEYGLWCAEQFGYPSVNQQLVELNMLDDCGSCGSVLLEAVEDAPEREWLLVADAIAAYMMNCQERKENGVFYRRQTGYFMENTLWADDLYMSVPFLIRYARLRERSDCMDEAARQFLLFRSYLFMPRVKLMSHVYDFRFNAPTQIAWGRGNGWVLFSLAELLTVLPAAHASYDSLMSFFLELSEGVLAVQGESGSWHQVLTDASSYEETSCTAMFVYAFARGLRLGWFPRPEPFLDAAARGWRALARDAVDDMGNVYGVSVGSRYSFSPDYYKEELPWGLNDTHGIGIVLLAGVETQRLHQARAERGARTASQEGDAQRGAEEDG